MGKGNRIGKGLNGGGVGGGGRPQTGNGHGDAQYSFLQFHVVDDDEENATHSNSEDEATAIDNGASKSSIIPTKEKKMACAPGDHSTGSLTQQRAKLGLVNPNARVNDQM